MSSRPSRALDSALAYADRGWNVFPLAPKSKRPHPRLAPHGMDNATDDRARIERWWSDAPDSNIGIACVKSGLLAIDIDPRNNGEETFSALIERLGDLPATVEAATGGGGCHLLFALPDGDRFVGELGSGVDVKARGYVVAPPSVHPDGGTYQWREGAAPDEHELAALPDTWAAAVIKRSANAAIPEGNAERKIEAGRRNNTLTTIGGRLRNVDLDAEELAAALEAINTRRCDPPLPSDEVRRIAASMARYSVAPGNGESGERVVLRPFSEVERKALRWLWNGRIARGEVTLLVGDPGLGKSQLTCWLSAEVTKDGGRALLASAEDSPSYTIRPRLEAAGANLDAVYQLQLESDGVEGSIRLPDDVDRIRTEIETLGGIDLLVVDPLVAHLPTTIDSYRDQHVRTAMAPLKRLADDFGGAVVVVMHLSKQVGDQALYRVGGSIGFSGAARSVLLLARDPNDERGEQGSKRVLANVKNNLGPIAPSVQCEVEVVPLQTEGRAKMSLETTSRIVVGEESDISAQALLAPTQDEDAAGALGEAIAFLEALLVEGPVLAKEGQTAARQSGIAPATLTRARKKRGVVSRQIKGEQHAGWMWILPEASDDHGDCLTAEGFDDHLTAIPDSKGDNDAQRDLAPRSDDQAQGDDQETPGQASA